MDLMREIRHQGEGLFGEGLEGWNEKDQSYVEKLSMGASSVVQKGFLS